MDMGRIKEEEESERQRTEITYQQNKWMTNTDPPETAKEMREKRQNVSEASGPPTCFVFCSVILIHGPGRLFNRHQLFVFVCDFYIDDTEEPRGGGGRFYRVADAILY